MEGPYRDRVAAILSLETSTPHSLSLSSFFEPADVVFEVSTLTLKTINYFAETGESPLVEYYYWIIWFYWVFLLLRDRCDLTVDAATLVISLSEHEKWWSSTLMGVSELE